MSDLNEVLQRLSETLISRRNADPDSSYVASLFAKGENAILKKIGEESTELVMAAKEHDKLHMVWEATDVLFHMLVLLAYHGLSADDILQELRRREGISGIDEKKSRKQ